MSIVSRAKRTYRALFRDVPRVKPDLRVATERHGTDYGGWNVLADSLGPDSRVFSVGVGTDASFDLSLIERYGCTVHAFDPTPKSVAWVESRAMPERFVMHRAALAATDGTLTLQPPANPEHVSFSATARPAGAATGATGDATGDGAIEVEAHRLGTLLDAHGLDGLDLLKMDIEGAEYAVVDDLIDSGARIDQLLVEFHHFFDAHERVDTEASIAKLRAAGYRLFSVSDSFCEYSFVGPGAAVPPR